MFDNIGTDSTMWFLEYVLDNNFTKSKALMHSGFNTLDDYILLSYSEVINLSARYYFEISDATIDAYNIAVDYEDVNYDSDDYEVF